MNIYYMTNTIDTNLYYSYKDLRRASTPRSCPRSPHSRDFPSWPTPEIVAKNPLDETVRSRPLQDEIAVEPSPLGSRTPAQDCRSARLCPMWAWGCVERVVAGLLVVHHAVGTPPSSSGVTAVVGLALICRRPPCPDSTSVSCPAPIPDPILSCPARDAPVMMLAPASPAVMPASSSHAHPTYTSGSRDVRPYPCSIFVHHRSPLPRRPLPIPFA
jgi:hypothetical protein